MLRIEELEEIEANVFSDSVKKYGKVLENTDSLLNLFTNMVIGYKYEAWVSCLLFTQVSSTLTMSLLSMLRRHEVQAQMMLRQSLESFCLTIFSLFNHSSKDFLKFDETGLIRPNSKISINAYKWIATNYNEDSNKLKFYKTMINDYFSHANLFNAPRNLEMKDGVIKQSFFDKEKIMIDDVFIWEIGNIICFYIEFLLRVLEDYPILYIDKDIIRTREKLIIDNLKIREEFMNNVRLSEYFK